MVVILKTKSIMIHIELDKYYYLLISIYLFFFGTVFYELQYNI